MTTVIIELDDKTVKDLKEAKLRATADGYPGDTFNYTESCVDRIVFRKVIEALPKVLTLREEIEDKLDHTHIEAMIIACELLRQLYGSSFCGSAFSAHKKHLTNILGKDLVERVVKGEDLD